MVITICGSIKFFDDMVKAQEELEKLGHTIYMPIKATGVDYWEKDNTKRVEAKKSLGLLSKHIEKIDKSDAILVVNMDKNEIKNYIGANTFFEMGYAHHTKKKIFTFNPLPDQPYIQDELTSFDPIVLNGDLTKLV